MKLKIRFFLLFLLLGVSLFIGVVIVAVAGGAIHPPINKIGAPFVCDGELVIESNRYSYKPGQVGVHHRIFCQSKTSGARTEVTFQIIFAAGLVYSGIVFIVLLAAVLLLRLGGAGRILSPTDMIFRTVGATLRRAQGIQTAEEISERLKKLQILRDSGQITEEEYQKKRTEILAGI